MKMTQFPAEERPREKLMMYGSRSLSTAELLAILIGSGGKGRSAMDVALALMGSRGIGALAECTPEELMEVDGIGRAKACELLAAAELGRRIASAPAAARQQVTTSEEVAALYMEKLRYYRKEHLLALLLNAKGEIMEEVTVSIGDLSSSASHPREVFAEAVRRSAGSLILIHNHPSGDPAPSEADLETTRRLREVGALMGIPVLDHLIIGDGRYTSFRAAGLLGEFE